jgi:hypothetical protein
MRSSSTEALSGIKVLDLCRVVSGPFATMHLGDLGADVVKIEDPRIGDESRRYGPSFINSESSLRGQNCSKRIASRRGPGHTDYPRFPGLIHSTPVRQIDKCDPPSRI